MIVFPENIMKQKIDWKIVCMGMACITAVELYALSIGINGTILKGFLIIIALAIGITIPKPNIIK